ncbi:MAG: hypothetical protein AAF658_13845, partial [Myxococcota bacterium]
VRRYELERYLAGELGEQEGQALRRELDSDPAAAASLEALRREQEDFEASVPYAPFRVEHERRKDARKGRTRRWFSMSIGLGVVAASAAVLFAVSAPETNREGVRLKGAGASLGLFVVNEDGVAEPGTSGQTVAPGTTVQLTYEAPGKRFGALFGVDETGAVSQLWPSRGSSRMALLGRDRGSFDFALTVDDTPGTERFFGLFSIKPEELRMMRSRLEQAGDSEIVWPPSVEAAMTSVVKPTK